MKNINISQNIAMLRKNRGVTQEQLAKAIHVSPQAVSKWETGTCQPDTQTLPLIADYFNVSIDFLYYGKDITYDDIYEKVFQKICKDKAQMSKESYEDALKVFGYAHHGISHGNLKNRNRVIEDSPVHISNKNGISLLDGRGYGAILTRAFFKNINADTAKFASEFLSALSDKDNMLVCMAIISMSDISFSELQEKLGMSEDSLRTSLDKLTTTQIVHEKKSKHKSLGFTYEINSMYHSCLCIIIATVKMLKCGLKEGISCCMGYGDFPIQL